MADKRFRGPLFLFVGGECRVYHCMDDGEIRESCGQGLPENFFGDVEGFAFFKGVVYQSQDWTPEKCEQAGIPDEAAYYSEWWAGTMVPATLDQVASVFSIPTPARAEGAVTEDQLNAAAAAFFHEQYGHQGGRWELVDVRHRHGWREKARAVLTAARAQEGTADA